MAATAVSCDQRCHRHRLLGAPLAVGMLSYLQERTWHSNRNLTFTTAAEVPQLLLDLGLVDFDFGVSRKCQAPMSPELCPQRYTPNLSPRNPVEVVLMFHPELVSATA